MELGIEIIAIVWLGVIGLSHLAQPKVWVDFFILLRSQGDVGAFIDGFLYLPFAALILGFHNVWSGIPVVLTLLGWGFLIKSLLRFCYPSHGLKMMSRVAHDRLGEFRVAGAVYVALALLLSWPVLTSALDY